MESSLPAEEREPKELILALAEHPDVFFFRARTADRTIGILTQQILGTSGHGFLGYLAVARDQRGKRVGQQLIEYSIKHAVEHLMRCRNQPLLSYVLEVDKTLSNSSDEQEKEVLQRISL